MQYYIVHYYTSQNLLKLLTAEQSCSQLTFVNSFGLFLVHQVQYTTQLSPSQQNSTTWQLEQG